MNKLQILHMATIASSRTLLKSRFRATFIGVICGDAYGALFESGQNKSLDAREIEEHIRSHRESKECILKFTDDTSMTKATCKSLLRNNGFDATQMAKTYSENYFENTERGYGLGVRRVFEQLVETNYNDPFGPASRQFDGKGSFGNGAAMRVSAVALFGTQMKLTSVQLNDLVDKVSRITHTNPSAILGAQLLASAITDVLNIDPDSLIEDDFLDHLLAVMEKSHKSEAQTYIEKLKIIKRTLDGLSVNGQDVSQSQIVELLGNDVSAQGSVPLAIYSFLRGISKFTDSYNIDNEFIRCMHWAISCGGDTDTIASMACGLSGAYLGLDKIPTDLFDKCEDYDEMISLADKVLALDQA